MEHNSSQNLGFTVNDFTHFLDNEPENHFCQHQYVGDYQPTYIEECGEPAEKKYDGRWLCADHLKANTHVVTLDDIL